MPNPPSDPDWHQWRGSCTEKLDQVLSLVRDLGHKFETHEHEDNSRFAKQAEDHDKLKTKVTWLFGAAAGIGTAIGTGIGWFFTSSGKQP